jgi:succinate-semialdehyde dehydrogenase/glutarate-semialdehyde dehydrogenase
MPWNFPVWQVVRFAVPALIAGNTVLLKHADNTTGVGKILEEIFQSIFPKNCFQLVLANHEQIAEVIADPRVAAVTLTGSERAGREVAAQAGKFLKKSVLELGGSDAYVILDDANIEKAAAICAEARLVNNGQSCVAAKRFIVHEKVHKLFVEALCANFKKKIVGDPLNEKMDIGPLAREDLRRDLAIQVEKSIAMGAKSVTGERNSVAPGFFYNPTILTDVKPGMPAFDEETFGPVAAVIKVQNEEEAIKLANLSRYGLGGAIFSENEERAEYLAREKLEVGFAAVNTNVVSDSRLPFGGIKNSGYGRELGSFGIKEFVNIKTISIRR